MKRVGVEPVARRILLYGLAAYWLIAGALQAQPDMFTTDFYAWYPANVMPSMLQLTAIDQPLWLQTVIKFGGSVWGQHPVFFNISAIILQLALGTAILVGMRYRWVQVPLIVSMVWAVAVWIFGEGMGDIVSGGASYFDGAPGPALVAAILAIVAMFPRSWWTGYGVGRKLDFSLAIFWLVMAVLQAWPAAGYWQGNIMMALFATGAALPQPNWIGVPMEHLALATNVHPVVWNAAFIVVMLLLSVTHAAAWRRPSPSRWILWLTLLWLFAGWWFGEDFGLFGGMSTDVGSIPLIGLCTVAAWKARTSDIGPAAYSISARLRRAE